MAITSYPTSNNCKEMKITKSKGESVKLHVVGVCIQKTSKRVRIN